MTISIILGFVLLGLVLLLALVLPSVTSGTVPFGVRIPAEYSTHPVVAEQARRYRRRVLVCGGVIAVVGVGSLALTRQPLLLPLSVLVLVGLWYGCFFLAHQEIRAAKVDGGWFEGLHQGVAVDTELRTNPPRFPWRWLAPAVVICAGTAVIGILMYPSMPQTLVVHYAGNGTADRLEAKSVGSAFSLVFLQLGLTALLAGLAAAIIHSRADLDPARPQGSARWARHYMALGAKALLGLVAMIDLGLMASSLLMWTGTVTRWAPLVIVVPVLASVVAAVTVLARNNADRGGDGEDTGLTHRDDDKFWRAGLIYINREDPALLVPRRFGIGWTLNFGDPRAAMLLAGVVALIVLVLTLRFGG